MDAMSPNFTEKTFTNSQKTTEIANSKFSPSKVIRYLPKRLHGVCEKFSLGMMTTFGHNARLISDLHPLAVTRRGDLYQYSEMWLSG